MAKQTKAQRLAETLIRLGYPELESSTTNRYRVFRRPANESGMRYYYVGKMGALRTGRTISDSYSIDADQFLQRWENKETTS